MESNHRSKFCRLLPNHSATRLFYAQHIMYKKKELIRLLDANISVEY